MELILNRTFKKEDYTIGKLYINGKYFCDTIEDRDRGLSNDMNVAEIIKKKVYGETAIPTGIYIVKMDEESPKFKSKPWAKDFNGIVPRLDEIKGFNGVLIHPGNYASDSLGCILVGENKIRGGLINSASTYRKLMDILINAKESIYIHIK